MGSIIGGGKGMAIRISQAKLNDLAKKTPGAKKALAEYKATTKPKQAMGQKHKSVCPILASNLKTCNCPEFRWEGHPEGEYRFHEKRRWLFDIYFIDYQIAIEVEGGIGSHRRGTTISNQGTEHATQSRHLTYDGFDGDAEKYFEAGMKNIFVIRVSPRMVKNGQAASMALQALKLKGWEPKVKNSAYTAFFDMVKN